jgi:glucosylceramidase
VPAPDEATFISQYLQPALARAGLHPKIYGNDLSWDQLAYADSLLSGPAAGDLNGIAWHCDFGSPTVMGQLHESAPGLDQIADECSPEIRDFGAPEYLISTLRDWASAVAVWNVALDPQGGPHGTAYGCPGCTGVVTIDEQSHTVSLTSEYYQLGQVSAYVQPGAVRIDSPNFVTYGLDGSDIETVSSGLDDVAFQNPDGSLVLITYNNSSHSRVVGAASSWERPVTPSKTAVREGEVRAAVSGQTARRVHMRLGLASDLSSVVDEAVKDRHAATLSSVISLSSFHRR